MWQIEGMYSPRVAYQEGRRIGRSIENLRIPDDELKALVIAHLRPTIKLRKSHEDEVSATATAAATLITMFAVGATALWIILVLWPDAPVVGQLPAIMLPLSAIATAVLWMLSIGLIVNATRRSSRAQEARDLAYEVILDEGFRGAHEVVAARRERAGLSVHRISRSSTTDRPLPSFDRQVSPQAAEELAAQWMRSLGAADARATSYIGDGGIDVESAKFIAQVKHHATPVAATAIRELAGVASIDPSQRRALFFSTSGYQPSAVEFADRTLVALFHMITETGDLRARNDIARQLLEHGLD